MAVRFVLPRPPQNDEELYWAVKATWGVTIPRTPVCPDHVTPFSAFADAFFARDGADAFWHGSRGLSGKSFTLSILGLSKAVWQGSDVNLLGGSMAQSVNVHEAMRSALDSANAPRDMIVKETSTKISFTNKAKVRPLTASQRTVRGPHPPTLLLDEIDEMDLSILDAALGQPLPQTNNLGTRVSPYTVMCSTWQNPVGTFTTVKRRFDEAQRPTKAWCYRESMNPVDGWLDEETVEAKKRQIPAEMWRVEYELGEPSIGNRAFDADAIEATFCLPFDSKSTALVTSEESRDYEEFTFERRRRNGAYVVAADWAKEQDYTVISVVRIDGDKIRLVYWCRVNRRPYPFMVGKYNEAIRAYNPVAAIHDGTGVGNAVNDYLDVRARGFQMTGHQRAEMLTEYVNAVEKGELELPRIPSAYVGHKYCQVGDLYSGSKEYHLPDEVCSLALAVKAARRYRAGVAGPVSLRKTEDLGKNEIQFVNTRIGEDPGVNLPTEGMVVREPERSPVSFSV